MEWDTAAGHAVLDAAGGIGRARSTAQPLALRQGRLPQSAFHRARAAVARRMQPSLGEIGDAARALRAGKLVAFPTETVYGLGGDATSDRAVAAIFAAKGRPSFNPLIVHVANISSAAQYRRAVGQGAGGGARASGPAR